MLPDEEYQIGFLHQVRGKRYLGETFPVFWPNLGPNVFAALYGSPLEFSDRHHSGDAHFVDYDQTVTLDLVKRISAEIESLTHAALDVCRGQFLVGYTDLHPGPDWLAALRGTEPLLLDMVDRPDRLPPFLARCTPDFLALFDHFDALLKAHGQPSITWMGIPSFGQMHIPQL